MPVTHEPWLVALSVIVAIQGAYVGLSLAVEIGGAHGARRRLLLAGAALSLGVAIWSMHFVGMLAARLPFEIDYLALPTLLSFLVCVLVVGVAVFAVSTGRLTTGRLVAAAIFMGLGIVSMHYIGMTALHASAHIEHSPPFVAASVVIAIAASGLALRLAASRNESRSLLLSAAALGIAISGMHYTAMAGVEIFPHPSPVVAAPALSSGLLAIIVAVVAFVVSGLFFLTLVPDRAGAATAALPEPNASPAAEARSVTSVPSLPAVPLDEDSVAAADTATEAGQQLATYLPVEHDGAVHHLSVDKIVAVRANAHYTYVFDGTATYFCSLPISDVALRLDPARFARVHRSHIINIDRVLRLKRAGDNGLVEMKAHDAYMVPVSRGRLAWVKSQIRTREAIS